jgi:NADPH:quinone reductase-like Zn-dependent oxidoreductase
MTGFVRGDEVYGTSNGSFAQYARARAGRVAPRPVNLSFEQVAGRPGFRARRPAGRARPRADPGRRQVLIIGASGGVGPPSR